MLCKHLGHVTQESSHIPSYYFATGVPLLVDRKFVQCKAVLHDFSVLMQIKAFENSHDATK